MQALVELVGIFTRPVRWLMDWIPHCDRLHITDAGVRIKGRKVKPLRHGFYWWIPNCTEILTVNIMRKARSLVDQTLTTADGKTVRGGAVIDFTIHNARTWLVENEDAEDCLLTEAGRVVCNWVRASEFKALVEDDSDDLTKLARAQLVRPFGIKLRRLGIDTIAQTTAKDFAHSGAGMAVDED